jgi:hypothetical protein
LRGHDSLDEELIERSFIPGGDVALSLPRHALVIADQNRSKFPRRICSQPRASGCGFKSRSERGFYGKNINAIDPRPRLRGEVIRTPT